jgi:hypothetical protein
MNSANHSTAILPNSTQISASELESALNRRDASFVIHHLTDLAALCPACLGTRLVPNSITQADAKDPTRPCSFCIAIIGESGLLIPVGIVHKNRLREGVSLCWKP